MYIHTDESAIETVINYMNIQGLDSIQDALADMECCYDDLDTEDASALNYFLRYPHILQKTVV